MEDTTQQLDNHVASTRKRRSYFNMKATSCVLLSLSSSLLFLCMASAHSAFTPITITTSMVPATHEAIVEDYQVGNSLPDGSFNAGDNNNNTSSSNSSEQTDLGWAEVITANSTHGVSVTSEYYQKNGSPVTVGDEGVTFALDASSITSLLIALGVAGVVGWLFLRQSSPE